MRAGSEKNDQNAPKVTTALLSLTGIETQSGLPDIFSIPLISLQIDELHKSGISRFCIEVEEITAAHTAMADDLRDKDIELQFLRSSGELNAAVAVSEMILILAAGISVDTAFTSALIKSGDAIVITLENNELHQGFERIDLQQQWGGIAIVPCSLIAGLGELPEGYSLPSAILREAIKEDLPVRQLAEAEMTACALQYTGDEKGTERLAQSRLSAAANNVTGLVERQLFVPLSAWFGGRHPPLFNWSGWSAVALSFLTVIIAFFNIAFLAAATGLLALFCLNAAGIWHRLSMQESRNIAGYFAIILLVLALVIAGYYSFGNAGIFAALMVSGLAITLHHLICNMADHSRINPVFLPSPALLAFLILGGAYFGILTVILQIFALLQLATILYLLSVILPARNDTA